MRIFQTGFLIAIFLFYLTTCSSTQVLKHQDLCLNAILDTLAKLNLQTNKEVLNNRNSTLFLDTNKYNVSINYLKSNPIFKKREIEQVLSSYDSLVSHDEDFDVKKIISKNIFSPAKYSISNYNLYKSISKNKDLYIKFSRFHVNENHKLILINFEIKNEMIYRSEILFVFNNRCQILKIIAYDFIN